MIGVPGRVATVASAIALTAFALVTLVVQCAQGHGAGSDRGYSLRGSAPRLPLRLRERRLPARLERTPLLVWLRAESGRAAGGTTGAASRRLVH